MKTPWTSNLFLFVVTLLTAHSAWAASAKEEIIAGDPVQLGIVLLVLGMGTVFTGLILVFFFLLALQKFFSKDKPIVVQKSDGSPAPTEMKVTNEMATAIALALYMDLRTSGEEEADSITIRKITRPFSPWWNAAKTQVMFDKVEIFRRNR